MKDSPVSGFRKLTAKFGAVKVLGVALIAALVVVSLVSTGISNGIQKARFDELIASAQEKLEAGMYDQAVKLVTQAEEEFPSGAEVTNALNNDISRAKLSSEALAEAKIAIRDRNYVDALIALARVRESNNSMYEEAQSKAEEIRPLAITDALAIAKVLASKGKFLEAVRVLVKVENAAGSTPELEKVKESYDQAAETEQKRARAAAFSKMSAKKDSFTGITWFKDRSSPNYRNSNGFYLYFGAESGSKNILRLVIQYFDDDWLFVDSAKINVDGAIYPLSSYGWERDNNSSIWEWVDEPLDDREMIEAIVKSKKSVIRFEGSQYYDTRTISAAQKTALSNVLLAYDNF